MCSLVRGNHVCVRWLEESCVCSLVRGNHVCVCWLEESCVCLLVRGIMCVLVRLFLVSTINNEIHAALNSCISG